MANTKRILILAILLLIMAAFVACSPQVPTTAPEDETPITTPEPAVQEPPQDPNLLKFDISDVSSLTISGCYWYDQEDFILSFREPGPSKASSLYSYNLFTKENQQFYAGDLRASVMDKFSQTPESIVYKPSDGTCTYIFNRSDLTLETKINTNESGYLISPSPDLKYYAKLHKSDPIHRIELFNTETNETVILDEGQPQHNSYFSIPQWSPDSSKVVYMTEEKSGWSVIDVNTLDRQTLSSGDFDSPDRIVDYTSIRFLPSDDYVLLTGYCETQNFLGIFQLGDSLEYDWLYEDDDVRVFNQRDNRFYCIGAKNSIVTYDYLTKEKTTLFSAQTIICASLAPDGNSVAFITFEDSKLILNIFKIVE